MATLLLQAAGTLVGGIFGPVGAALGAAAGSLAGYAVDNALFGSSRRIEGARLAGARPLTAEEGVSVPRIFGQARISGTVIWATRFEETVSTERQGAKGGGPKVRTYSYFANVAIGLCEGPVSAIKRVWADGKELDLTGLTMRVYKGDADQPADPLIEAKQGIGNTPAYRNLAYLVLERLPLDRFGNRIPQIQVEVVRAVGALEQQVRAMCLIPGSTEHGYQPALVTASARKGETRELNRHVLHAESDFEASIDELQAVCPNLEHVNLIVAWFGDDLRAGQCRIRPGVVSTSGGGESEPWSVDGLDRDASGTHVVSAHGGRPAYGGTPTDASVIAAIQNLKARGLKVTLSPFLMMDVPATNSLPDPWSDGFQPAYPWRGRVTCDPAIGQLSSADKTIDAAQQIGDFYNNSNGYRRLIMHYANLAVAAGGVDAIVIGSEMRGLTQVRDDTAAFPFVDRMKALAADVRAVVGSGCKLTYGADWSEYFGYHPQDGTGDVLFHLDPLWSDANIDAVGIDNYMPVSDWRDADLADPAANPDGARHASDVAAFRAAIAGGEGYDWYYASDSDRRDRLRTAITDGDVGKPWVFRYKDLTSWWSNQHYDRIGGVEAAQPSGWVPMSKPVWMTEIGCPAVDKGATQPNVFVDAKSTESSLPWYSAGGRDDGEQRAFLEAHHDHWSSGIVANPLSTVTGEAMVDPSRLYCWAWDARPFPAFPMAGDAWGDGENWPTGHWLNGRLGNAPLRETLLDIIKGHGLDDASLQLADAVQGIIIGQPAAARDIIEPLAITYGLAAYEDGGKLVLEVEGANAAIEIDEDEVTDIDGEPLVDTVYGEEAEQPTEVVVGYRDGLSGYRSATAYSRRIAADHNRQSAVELPCVADPSVVPALADRVLANQWARSRLVRLGLPLRHIDLVPGRSFALASSPDERWIVTRTGLGGHLAIEAMPVASRPVNSRPATLPAQLANAFAGDLVGRPDFVTIDLPLQPGASPEKQFKIAAWSLPPHAQSVHISPGADGFEHRTDITAPAVMGKLDAPLAGSFSGRLDFANAILLSIPSGEFSSVSRAHLLAGQNSIAIHTQDGGWEVVQFATAEEVSAGQWRLSGLLRGQGGTEDAMASGATAGARAVLLDQAVVPVGLRAWETGLELQLRVGPAGRPFTDRYFETVTAIGGVRARLPLSPVHLRADRQADGSILLGWIRRSRVDADSWDGTDVPLGEDIERYVTRIREAGAVVWEAEANATAITIDAAQAASLGLDQPQAQLDLGVAQFSLAAGEGIEARKTIIIA
ncbi:baseplate multidomain protein megatron [Oricola sp.]|uniref:baseplate multidomain protein megatron n=1 Tax=Oricola sp. TaxID=1979950 RepID=UPI003BAC9AFF